MTIGGRNVSDKSGACGDGQRNSGSHVFLISLYSSTPAYVQYMSINSSRRKDFSIVAFDVHAGRSAIYDHRRALKASRLSLLNASRYSVAPRDVSFLPLLLHLFSLPLPPPLSLPFTFLLLYLSFVRALHIHIHKSRECARTCAYARRLNTYERLTRSERSTRPNYFKLSYNRIKLPIIGDCIA